MKPAEEYFLSKHTYGCVYHFAMRYNEFKKELQELERVYTSPSYNAAPTHNGTISNHTERIAIERYNIKRKMEKIEKAAHETSPDLYKWILLGATNEYGYTYLKNVLDIPCSKGTYYRYIKRYYWILAKLMKL